MTDVVNRSSADESEEKPRTLSLTENSPTSAGIESEYDTASTNSRSDNERDEYENSEEEDSLDDEEEEVTDDEDEGVDDERESGDGQEELESEGGTKKKVDHDEDRSNPQYIPKKGTFYEHDDRTVEDLGEEENAENSENIQNSTEGLSTSGKVLSTQNQKVTPKVVRKATDKADRWTHDRFNEYEQAPKSRSELVSAYGYDIRNEDGPPRPRRQRRYGRNQSKYSRNWEDEEAYKKSQAVKPRRLPRPEDFPALGSTTTPKSTSRPRDQLSRPPRRRQQDENDPQSSSNYRSHSPVRSRENQRPSPRDDRERGPRDQRNQRYNNDTSNNNNARHVKGKKNINFNHNIEFKNQNRKNINYDSQAKNNNVLNQQMQSSSHQQHGHQQHQSPQQSQPHHAQQQGAPHHHQQQSNQQRYNNNENPMPTLSFTNSKMNNATNNSNAAPTTSSRGILNYDNSSSNYGRGSREKEVNSQQQQMQQQHAMHNQAQAMSPNKNIQQYGDHQMDQMKLMEKNYQQQQGKTTNLNLNQIPQHQQPQLNNIQDTSGSLQINNAADMSRSKRYSSLRQRSNLNDAPPPQQQSQQQAPPPQQTPSQTPQQYHPQYHPQQQELEPSHVAIPPQQTQAYMPTSPAQQQTAAVPGQAQQQAQKYQAAYYAANPASEYALMQAAMVEKYQYQQPTPPAQYLPPQQAQQIYMPTQTPPTQQQQILNYVSTIQPQPQAGAPTYPQYTNYQNYNIQAPPAAAPQPQQPAPPPPAQTTPQPIYQTQSGLTYYPAPSTQIAPAHQQRIIQPQRRPNPIPILAPPDHKAKSGSNATSTDDGEKGGDTEKNSAENIDHILDNMFVQRPMTNMVSLKESAPAISGDDKNDDQINDGMNTMSIDEKKSGEGGK